MKRGHDQRWALFKIMLDRIRRINLIVQNTIQQALRRQRFAGVRGGVNQGQGLIPSLCICKLNQ
jgi:hypothetical protein